MNDLDQPDPVQAQHKSEAIEAGFQPDESRGIFLMQGQRLSLSSFSISINDDGEVTSEGPTLSTGVEMTPYWLAIAATHANSCARLVSKTNEAWNTNDPKKQVAALNAEFSAALQAITAAAFAIDALYATLKEVMPVPEATHHAWKKNRTRRSRRVFETIRRCFSLGQTTQRMLKSFLDQLFAFRDEAVHPSARTRLAIKHPRLPVGVDEAFCKFRARNAWISVGAVIEIVEGLLDSKNVRSPELAKRLEPLKTLVRPIARKWRRSAAGKRRETDTVQTEPNP